MKDNKLNATHAAEQNLSQNTNNRQQPASHAVGAGNSKPAMKIAESERINRRYSFDDNGGGYLGL